MGSNKYVGYVGGVAVAIGVGAAVAAASQGVASADTGKSDSSSASDSAKTDAGPKKAATGNTKRSKPVSKLNDTPSSAAASDTTSVAPKATSAKTTAVEFEAAQVKKLQGLFTGHAAPRPAAATPTTTTETTAAATAAATVNPATAFWNPFRWMPPEPAPQDMPGPIWTLEESFMAIFPNSVKAVAREGFELGYRLTQMIPWVNVIVPLTNIVTDLPTAFAGDKAAAQRVINNLIVTIHPVAVLYYGYNEIADVLNLEAPALQLQTWFISSLWNLLDPFALLHIRGEAGLPLSTTTPPPDQVTPEAAATTTLAAAVKPSADAAALPTIDVPDNPDPFRADDPTPIGMPAATYNIEKALVALAPEESKPYVREIYEASWRISQMAPGLGVVASVANLLPAFYQAALGHRDSSQAAINSLLLTTTPLSILYYGYDQLADLMNVEEEAQALKVEIYAAVWDEADPNGYLHVPGHSGLKTV
ncbi:conserved exported hypothetical protein [uncultured Mycobacterium sp.]|uniref:Uncharacterized protein n=1 Tax=uncultured Mycobacterium sp. TaxID=171292 RepID=A0A1Y5PQU7_9MYCO|nr:conserved exported hypothetical protein [uncultured Mycobacterium sp.]